MSLVRAREQSLTPWASGQCSQRLTSWHFSSLWGSSVGSGHQGKAVPGSTSKADITPKPQDLLQIWAPFWGRVWLGTWDILLLLLLPPPPPHCSPKRTVNTKCWLPAELAALLAATESKYHCALVAISAHHEDALNPSLSQV